MLGLIALLQKVQVVVDRVRLVCRQLDLHVEFTPSFFLDPERRVLECCIGGKGGKCQPDLPMQTMRCQREAKKKRIHTLHSTIPETRMQVECHFVK